MTISRRTLIAVAAALAVVPLAASPRAQTAADPATFPNQMVRLVVPFSAGSMTDILAGDRRKPSWPRRHGERGEG
jgi:tripartite-type tricarboxylate transporter receptor subunit TctC